ncbi:hypothetical protein BpHYR1_029009 [Brachionus plicatilis]|uniref:Uncharacterized protein n=1 Tax=Brachionus plicatilis TaxID=10195 RepID=A0A3M7SWS8_BRAPC|nr:hypothetical protein BpHYR1_029009 [Brachionus plicatilis]
MDRVRFQSKSLLSVYVCVCSTHPHVNSAYFSNPNTQHILCKQPGLFKILKPHRQNYKKLHQIRKENCTSVTNKIFFSCDLYVPLSIVSKNLQQWTNITQFILNQLDLEHYLHESSLFKTH